MNRDLPSLDLLKAFEASARHLSFTRAAAELFLSQSAVSRQIQQLETQLGVPLFIRRTRALLLTEAGRQYYRDVSQALHQLREAGARLHTAADSQMVTVTTTVTFASLWLVPQLADFQQQHPDIEVRVAADNAVRDLARDRIDMAIRLSPRARAGEGAQRLFGEHTVPVCSPKLLGKRRLRSADELFDFVLLHFDDPALFTPWLNWDVWFESMHVQPRPPKGVLRFSHYDMMVRAAINGQGIGLGRMPLLASLLEDGTLVAPLADVPEVDDAADRAYWLYVNDAARERPAVRTFIDWLTARTQPLDRKPAASPRPSTRPSPRRDSKR